MHATYLMVHFFTFSCFECFAFQEYTEEFRDISGKSSKKLTGGSIADGNITLINQRHVGDDLPVIYFMLFSYNYFCMHLLFLQAS